MLHEETVAPETLDLIKRLSADKMLQDFALVGGTALALQLGHRKSVDIDLFGSKDFFGGPVANHLEGAYRADITSTAKNNVFGRIGKVQIGMISHQYPMVTPLLTDDGVRMASLDDIGAMKMHAIVNSGRRLKDFVDMYYILEHRTLDELTKAYASKYPDRNATLARNAILFHGDIRKEAKLDLLLRPFNWKEITFRLRSAVTWPGKVFERTIVAEKKTDEPGQSVAKNKKGKGKRL